MIPLNKRSNILYSSQKGTNGEVMLSKNKSNYNTLEIFYGNNSKTGVGSIKVLPSSKGFDTYIIAGVTEGTQLFINSSRYTMSENKLTPSICIQTILTKTSTSVTSITNQIYIYKVVGYI